MSTSVSDLEIQPTVIDDVPADKSLVLKFKTGSTDAYDEIFERYRPLAASICLRILGNRDDAEEAVQETMLRVLRGLPNFNGRYQLQAWIARIATNVSVDMVRARARRPQSALGLHDLRDDAVADAALDPEKLVERILDQELVRSTLDEIPSHHREALMLREFEGRSHEEIGDAMGVSPAQAKALIHRAKGTFRRAWTGEDRRGIAGFLPWFLIPALLRRLGGAAQTLATRVTSAPAAVTEATASTAEKVTAAAVAVVVAGTVGVGALAVRHAQRTPTKPSPAAVAPAVVPSPPAVVPPAPPQAGRSKPVHKHKSPKHHKVVPVIVVPSPSSGPSSTPSGPPSPSSGPSDTPGPTVPPVVGPAPAWGLTFRAGTGWGGPCSDCPAAPWLMSSQVSGTAGQSVTISQVAQGAALDSQGNPAWKLYLQYWGSAEGQSGQLQYQFKLETSQGWYSYSGTAALTSAGASGDGGYLYTFSGGYQLTDAPGSEGVPHQGSLQILLHFWPDGTSLYATDISLSEV